MPALPASTEPKTMRVKLLIDGKTAIDRVCKNILIGDLWYIASPSLDKKQPPFVFDPSGQTVRTMTRKSKRSSSTSPARYMISTSTDPNNEYASTWDDSTNDFAMSIADGAQPHGGNSVASAIGHRLAKQSGRPTGVIHMTSKEPVQLNSWMKIEHLKDAPSLMADYENLAQMQPGHKLYDTNVRRYIGEWKKYWGEFIPEMIATRAVPNGESWGAYPNLAANVTSKATQTHNVCVYSFIPNSFKGIIFLSAREMLKDDQGKNFGPELTALANGWIGDFGGKTKFLYTLPNAKLAPAITAPQGIKGESQAIEISDWKDLSPILEAVEAQK